MQAATLVWAGVYDEHDARIENEFTGVHFSEVAIFLAMVDLDSFYHRRGLSVTKGHVKILYENREHVFGYENVRKMLSRK